MADKLIAELLECAKATACVTGAYARDNRHRRRDTHQRLAHDVKLELDLECQAMAEKAIRERFPQHRILGEEDTEEARVSNATEVDDYLWIIDPIDGTVNFSHGFFNWCCSVAVWKGQTPLVGAVFAPDLDKLFWATADSPAFCNGEEIHVSPIDNIKEAVVFTGLDKHDSPDRPSLSIFSRITRAIERTRVVGAAALDICHVAQGMGEGYFEKGIYLWDIAAASLVLERAGGRWEYLSPPDDTYRTTFMASNDHLHAALKNAIAYEE